MILHFHQSEDAVRSLRVKGRLEGKEEYRRWSWKEAKQRSGTVEEF